MIEPTFDRDGYPTEDEQAPAGRTAKAVYDFLWPIYRDGAWGRGSEIRAKFLAASDVNAIRREAVKEYRAAVDPDPLYVGEDSPEPAPVLYASLLAAVIVLLPAAVVCLWVLGRACDVLRALIGRAPG